MVTISTHCADELLSPYYGYLNLSARLIALEDNPTESSFHEQAEQWQTAQSRKKVELVSTFMQADSTVQAIRINMPLADQAVVRKPKNGSYAVYNPGCAGKSGNGNPPLIKIT